MTATIVVGYDDSDQARDAIALADALAAPLQAELVIAAVFRTEPGYGTVAWGAFEREVRDSAAKTLEAAPSTASVVSRRVLGASSAAHGLHQLAADRGAMLIVVGSTHRGAVGRLAIGSTAEALLHGAPCPVAVAPKGYAEGDHKLATVGVAFDGSPESRHAVSGAAALTQAAGAALRVIHAVEEPLGHPYGAAVTRGELVKELMDRARSETDGALAELPEGLEAEAEVAPGAPVEVLAERSRALDLMACGSRGYGLLRQVLLGSVSTRLVREAACPIVVFPRGASDLRVPGFPAQEAQPA